MEEQNNYLKIVPKLNNDKIINKKEEKSKNINKIINTNKLNKILEIEDKKNDKKEDEKQIKANINQLTEQETIKYNLTYIEEEIVKEIFDKVKENIIEFTKEEVQFENLMKEENEFFKEEENNNNNNLLSDKIIFRIKNIFHKKLKKKLSNPRYEDENQFENELSFHIDDVIYNIDDDKKKNVILNLDLDLNYKNNNEENNLNLLFNKFKDNNEINSKDNLFNFEEPLIINLIDDNNQNNDIENSIKEVIKFPNKKTFLDINPNKINKENISKSQTQVFNIKKKLEERPRKVSFNDENITKSKNSQNIKKKLEERPRIIIFDDEETIKSINPIEINNSEKKNQ